MNRLTETYTDSEEEEDNNADSVNNINEVLHETNLNDKRPKFTKLVSYHDNDEAVISDEEMDTGEVLHEIETSNNVTINNEEEKEEEIILPPEPTGKCSSELQEKISKIFDKKNTRGYDMNEVIQKRKEFRNPSIYEKLVEYCSINEFGTNYEPHMYDPLKWNKTSFYDELARVQRLDLEQKMKELSKKKVKKTGVIIQQISNVSK